MNKNAKESLCWTCKHGVCIRETESELMMPQLPDAPVEQRREVWQEESQPREAELLSVEQDRVKAICFWRPPGIDSPPILVANVTQCSRYTKEKE